MAIKTSKVKPKDVSGSWLYADGGVLNDAQAHLCAAAWAYREVLPDGSIGAESSGVVLPADIGVTKISSTLAEFYAIVQGLSILPDGWAGHIGTDNQFVFPWMNASLGAHNIPVTLFAEYRRHVMRLSDIEVVYCRAHPTLAQIVNGVTFKNEYVSEHHVACDNACRAALVQWKREHAPAVEVAEPVIVAPRNPLVEILRDRGWYHDWLCGEVVAGLLDFQQTKDARALQRLQKAACELEEFAAKV